MRQGDVLSPNLFKIFVNDIPECLLGCIDAVELNGKNVECLLYADDVVLFSSNAAGLQQRLNSLSKFCKDWCLDVNINKTNVLVLNKAGRLCNENFYFDATELECVQHYRYLGLHFSATGCFSQGKTRYIKTHQKHLSKYPADLSIRSSINLYDQLIKPIVLYGSEIWGTFRTNTSRCKKDNEFLFKSIYTENIADKSHLMFLKYIKYSCFI